jgi:hypothetical protein
MSINKTTTVSRFATTHDLDRIIFADHPTVPVVITVPNDTYLGIKDEQETPVLAIQQKGDAVPSFTAGAGVAFVGTAPTAVKDGKPIAMMRHGVNISGVVVWGYL